MDNGTTMRSRIKSGQGNLVLILLVSVGGWCAGCTASVDQPDSTEPSEVGLSAAWNSEASLREATLKIEALLDLQTDSWNRGDIPGFMAGYWKSPELRFASGGSVNRGWQVTLDRYLSRYPDRAAMGQLRFEDRDIDVLGPGAALVFGRWILDRDQDQPQGLFSLLVRRVEDLSGSGDYAAAGNWRVVADHTSSASS